MRCFPFMKYSRAAVSVPVSLLALGSLGCSGSNPQAVGSSPQALATSCSSAEGGAPRDAGPLADSGTGDAGSPVGPLSLRVVGNRLVDASSHTVRLLGVNHSGQEFKCIQGGSAGSLGWGIFDGPTDLASVNAIASWHANTVRVPLNEDCWLGINGVNPSYSGAAYQAAIAGYVSTIHQAGLYVILDLHWNAPGTLAAAAQQPMPDADHAVDFWKSVAARFSSDPAVVFDLYNEPFLYGSYLQNSSADPWDCWLNGCGINQYLTGGTPYTQSYAWNAVGMQTLVNAVRSAGANNPIMVGGLDWANDLSGWLTHEPHDPNHAIVAAWHSYPGQGCSSMSCWTSVVAPVAAQVPVVTGETGDNVGSAATYVDSLLPWEDSQGISYLGWTWNTWGDPANILITDYAGAPSNNYGQKFHDLLAGSNPMATAPVSTADASADSSPTIEAAAPTADAAPVPAQAPPPGAMPLISQGLPAYTNYAQSPASSAVDADYSTVWRTGHNPTTGDSNWLAIDLSSVPMAQRTTVYAIWFNEYGYNYDTSDGSSYTLPGDYEIQANPSPSGAPPATGWVTLASKAGNLLSSGANLLHLDGYNWVRFQCTASASNVAVQNTDTSLQWNLYDAHSSNDGWKFAGDSITANSMGHQSTNDSFDQLVHRQMINNPAFEMAGHGGWSANTMLGAIDGFLADFPGRYFGLSFGTNDAPGNDPVGYAASMSQLIDKVIAAGKTPIVPTIPYTGEPAHAPIPSYNAQISALYARYGSALVQGPDLYKVLYDGRATMFDNQTDLHPNATGNAAIRQAWADAMVRSGG
jgi:endoglucanase